jgi:hypothetical protein
MALSRGIYNIDPMRCRQCHDATGSTQESDELVLAADSRGTFGNPVGVTAQNNTMIKTQVMSGHTGALN